jgi:hypothetical protein
MKRKDIIQIGLKNFFGNCLFIFSCCFSISAISLHVMDSSVCGFDKNLL